MNIELRLIHSIAGSNKHDKSARYQVTDFVKITYQEYNIRKQCLEQDNNMLQEHIMATQGMA